LAPSPKLSSGFANRQPGGVIQPRTAVMVVPLVVL